MDKHWTEIKKRDITAKSYAEVAEVACIWSVLIIDEMVKTNLLTAPHKLALDTKALWKELAGRKAAPKDLEIGVEVCMIKNGSTREEAKRIAYVAKKVYEERFTGDANNLGKI